MRFCRLTFFLFLSFPYSDCLYTFSLIFLFYQNIWIFNLSNITLWIMYKYLGLFCRRHKTQSNLNWRWKKIYERNQRKQCETGMFQTIYAFFSFSSWRFYLVSSFAMCVIVFVYNIFVYFIFEWHHSDEHQPWKNGNGSLIMTEKVKYSYNRWLNQDHKRWKQKKMWQNANKIEMEIRFRLSGDFFSCWFLLAGKLKIISRFVHDDTSHRLSITNTRKKAEYVYYVENSPDKIVDTYSDRQNFHCHSQTDIWILLLFFRGLVLSLFDLQKQMQKKTEILYYIYFKIWNGERF